MQTVGFIRRFFAFFLDKIIISIIILFFNKVAKITYSYPYSILFSLFIDGFYFTYFHGTVGQTIGKKLFKIKVVDKDTYQNIGILRSFLRWIGYFVSSLFLYLGFFWVILDKNNQAWHDKIVKTFVIFEED